MEGLYSWVGNLTFYLIFITVVNNLLPNRRYERYLKLFTGMVMILLVLQPITGSLRLEDRIAYYFESITFRNESVDLKKELLGMEDQRLTQMIDQYEKAVASDVGAMAEDMEFFVRKTEITIEKNQEEEAFGTVTHIRMAVSREEIMDVAEDGMDPIEAVEPVRIGESQEQPVEAAAPDEGLNRLRRKVEGYYGLQTTDVEIWLEEREG